MWRELVALAPTAAHVQRTSQSYRRCEWMETAASNRDAHVYLRADSIHRSVPTG